MLANGEHLLDFGESIQWVSVSGAEHTTTPLLVLHGGPGAQNLLYERSAGPLIRRNRTLVLHEQRGCGRSPHTEQLDYTLSELVDDVCRVIDRLGEPVDLLGWSFGGDLAARVALGHPSLVRRLVLQAPAIDFQSDVVTDYLLHELLTVCSEEFRPRVKQAIATEGTNWDRLLLSFDGMDQESGDRQGFFNSDRAAWAQNQWNTPPAGFTVNNLAMLRSLTSTTVEYPIWDRLGEISTPALVVTGDHDHNVDPARTAQVAGRIPGARLVVIPDCCHQPDVDCPDRYSHVLLDFLDEEQPADA